MDNNSTDDSKYFFNNRFPSVQFIWKKENVGFAKANNEALTLAKGEKILFLNPDTVLPEDCFENCLQFFNQQNNIGALGVQMIDGGGNFLPESKRGFPSLFISFCKMTGLTNIFPHSKIFARYYLGHLPQNKNNEVDVLSGAFMMIEKKVLDDIGGFDESYFMYAEDIDLSYRIQKAGYKNFYLADTSIIHFKGESTVKQSASHIRNFYGTMVLFIKKHHGKIPGFFYSLILRFFIGIKIIFSKTGSSIAKQTLTYNKATLLCDEETYMELQPALQQHFKTTERKSAITGIPKNDAVFLCEPFLNYKEIISLLIKNKNKYSFFIYTKNCNGIIGSGNKNHPGYVFAIGEKS